MSARKVTELYVIGVGGCALEEAGDEGSVLCGLGARWEAVWEVRGW